MKVRIKEVAEKQGIGNAKQLARLTGLSVTSCYQLWNGTAKAISFESINTLCNVLQAGPVLLLEYTPDVERQRSQSSPSDDSLSKSMRESAQKLKRGRKASAVGEALGKVKDKS